MTQATPYTRSTGFADDERNNAGGRATVRTAQVDTELDAIGSRLNLTGANLALIQRDDGQLRDGIVTTTALAPDTLKLLTTGTAVVRGAWLTATAYLSKDLVTQSGNTYICAVAHTSGVFATDLAAVKWVLFQLGTNPTAIAVAFTPSGNIGSTTVQGAIVEVDSEIRSDFADAATPTKGAGALGFGYAVAYAAGSVGLWLQSLAIYTGASLIGWMAAGASAVTRTLQSKLRDKVNIRDYGAVMDGVTDDSAAFSKAVAALPNGGTIEMGPGVCYIGTGSPAISLPFYISLVGAGDAYHNPVANGLGTELLYGGTGTAIYCQGMNIHAWGFSVRAAAPSGTSMIGLIHDGGWFSSFRRITFKNFPPANGFAFKMTSGPAMFGAYWNVLEQVNGGGGKADFSGRNASDEITTLSIKDSAFSQATFAYTEGTISGGAFESWTSGNGLNFVNNCVFNLDGVDIEQNLFAAGSFVVGQPYVITTVGSTNWVAIGAASNTAGVTFTATGVGAGTGIAKHGQSGINFDGTCSVRDNGTTNWAGYQGAIRVTGTMTTPTYGPLDSQQQFALNTPAKYLQVGRQAASQNEIQNFISDYINISNLIGGAQTAWRIWKRWIAGVELICHDWNEDFILRKVVATAGTSPIVVFSFSIPASEGIEIKVTAHGLQVGDQPLCNSRIFNIINNAGTVTSSNQAQITSGNAGLIGVSIVGTTFNVTFTPTIANASSITFVARVTGPLVSYT